MGIGGRILPYKEGHPDFDQDVYRGQRRRPWASIRVGNSSIAINDKVFINYVAKVRSHLISAGILLDGEGESLLFKTQTCGSFEDIRELDKQFKEALKERKKKYEDGLMSKIITICINDFSPAEEDLRCEFDDFVARHQEEWKFMNIFGSELIQQEQSEDYSELEEWCAQMAEITFDIEDFAQSRAVPQPIQKKSEKFGSHPGIIPIPKQRVSKKMSNHQNRNYVAEKPQVYIAPPPGLELPTNLPEMGTSSLHFPPPGLTLNRNVEITQPQRHVISAPVDFIEPPPGLSRHVQPASNANSHSRNDRPPQPTSKFNREQVTLVNSDEDDDDDDDYVPRKTQQPRRQEPSVPQRQFSSQPSRHEVERPNRSYDSSRDHGGPNVNTSGPSRDYNERPPVNYDARPNYGDQRFVRPPRTTDNSFETESNRMTDLSINDSDDDDFTSQRPETPGSMTYKYVQRFLEDHCVTFQKRMYLKVEYFPGNRMASEIDGQELYNRLEHPFQYDFENLDFLTLINYALATKNEDVTVSIKNIIKHIIHFKYPMLLTEKFFLKQYNRREYSKEVIKLMFETIHLFGYTCQNRPNILALRELKGAWNLIFGMYECFINHSRQFHFDKREGDSLFVLARSVNQYFDRAFRKNDAEIKERTGSSVSTMNGTMRATYSDDIPSSSRQSDRYPQDDNYDRQNDTRRDRESYGADNEHRENQRVYQEDERTQRVRHESNQLSYQEDAGRSKVNRDSGNSENSRSFGRNPASTNHVDQYEQRENRRVYDERHEEESDHSIISDFADEQPPKPITTTTRQIVPIVENLDEQVKKTSNFSDAKKQTTAGNSQSIERPLWDISETKEPPNDFRELTPIPTLADYVDPVAPYLRRIRDDGIYTSSDHYLDVQYRLLREDLVSPLRDGIDVHRKNGTHRGRRMENEICSDISLYDIVNIDGKQASTREGIDIRYAYPSSMSISKMTMDQREMKGSGLVMLSSDGFQRDMHLAVIHDSLLNTPKQCLILAILHETETSPLRQKVHYQMAEGNSYLPAYQFVLENLRKLNKFIPIPFERYIVHGKKTIFRPAYHRQVKGEEQLSQESTIQKHYEEKRSVWASKRLASGLPISMVSKKTQKSQDDDFGFFGKEHYKVTRSLSDDQIDDELRQVCVPIYPDPIGAKSADEGNKIQIDNQWFDINTLLTDYNPDYMDESQKIAFCKAMSREFSIIQGPPGTGKTHLGVNIVKTMLLNRNHWCITTPILVVCFTNSAIDQFLERIWIMMEDDEELSKSNGAPKMIRFGSKSDSELLKKKRVLKEAVKDDYRDSVDEETIREMNRLGGLKRKKAEDVAMTSFSLFASKNEILSFDVIKYSMRPEFQEEVINYARCHLDTKGELLNNDEALACWLMERNATSTDRRPSAGKLKFKVDDEEEQVFTLPDEAEQIDSDCEDLNDEQILDRILKMNNEKLTSRDVMEALKEEENCVYETKKRWDIVDDTNANKVIIFGKKLKVAGRDKYITVDEELAKKLGEDKELILKAQMMNDVEEKDVRLIYSLTRPQRWAIYQRWCFLLRQRVIDQLDTLIANYRKVCADFIKSCERLDVEITRKAKVIGMTTTGCARLRPILEAVQPKILIVEEAAEVLESHIMSAMISSVEHVVMIGDHQQLRPNPAVYELAIEYGLQISMFERLVERGLPYCQLKEQHRMNENIANLIVRPSFYRSVHDAAVIYSYPQIRGLRDNLYFWSHSKPEHSPDTVSWQNNTEVDMAIKLADHLLKNGYKKSEITIITTYSAQRAEMIRRFSNYFGDMDFSIETVDSYQGRENKIVIVSLVRSYHTDNEFTGIGFLWVKNRICVALTRAQHGMYILGNAMYLANQSSLWSEIVGNLNKKSLVEYYLPVKCTPHGNIENITSPSDFNVLSHGGGCSQDCNMMKECGHVCRRKCHPNFEMDHIVIPCTYDCLQKCSNPKYHHPCNKKCAEVCGPCSIFVEVEMPCGHQITTSCSKSDSASCDQKCNKTMDCNHSCKNKCGAECTKLLECTEEVEVVLSCTHSILVGCNTVARDAHTFTEQDDQFVLVCDHSSPELCGPICSIKCQKMVSVELDCGHSVDVECSEYAEKKDDLSAFKCETKVPRKLKPCGHTVAISCGSSPVTVLCTVPCEEELADCGHQCGDACGNCYKTKHHKCQSKCERKLECGHDCSSKCGEDCQVCVAYCTTACSHSKCGINGYGRTCHQLCILCIESCKNRCQHRSCSKKCFEECDVTFCEHTCSERLPCGHACLGLCGENCPRLCATCNRKAYEACISNKKDGSLKFERLIQIPGCNHIFPASFLDQYVHAEKEKDNVLICPDSNCKQHMYDIARYAKYIKHKRLEQEKSKARGFSIRLNFMNTKSEILSRCHSRMNDCMNNPRSMRNNVKSLFTRFQDLFYAIRGIVADINDMEKKYTIDFYDRLSTSVAHLSSNFRVFYTLRLKTVKRNRPPQIDNILYTVFGNRDDIEHQTDIMMKTVNMVFGLMSNEQIGTLIPRLHYEIARIVFMNQVLFFAGQLENDKTDINATIARGFQNTCMQFYQCAAKDDYESCFLNVERIILQHYPTFQGIQGFATWAKLKIGTF